MNLLCVIYTGKGDLLIQILRSMGGGQPLLHPLPLNSPLLHPHHHIVRFPNFADNDAIVEMLVACTLSANVRSALPLRKRGTALSPIYAPQWTLASSKRRFYFANFIFTQARSYIGTRGQFPVPDGCFAPPPSERPTSNFFLHINFPSPVSLDAQM